MRPYDDDMRKVLIVSPHFSPINAPDMQRTRMALPFLRDLGWEPVVLAVRPEMVEGGVWEPLLEQSYPGDVRVVRVGGIRPEVTRRLGFGSLWWRCGAAIRRAGETLLGSEKFDLVFFSTTQFDAFSLGPAWKERFGTPYVLDYQDPWINDYYKVTGTRPPGGHIKFGLSQWSARRNEPKTLKNAAAVIAVSDAYGTELARNNPGFKSERVHFLPFGASERDIQIARMHRPNEPLFDFNDGDFHHVYTGRCGPDMSIALRILFRAFKRYLANEPEKAARVRFHFIGTDYAPRPLGREWVMPTARLEGVERFVSEYCYRIPYFDALYYLSNAQALLVIGSNDPTYSASKIFPYVLANRPLLVVFNERSPVMAMAAAMKVDQRYSFARAEDVDIVAGKVSEVWFSGGGMNATSVPDMSAFEPYAAKTITGRLAEIFDEASRVPGETK